MHTKKRQPQIEFVEKTSLTNAKRCDIIIKLSDESMVRKRKMKKTFKKYLTNALTSDIMLKLSERQQAS